MDKSMTSKLSDILGEERLKELAQVENDDTHPTNKIEIHCDCDTLILRPNNARLILPSDSMLEVERELKNFQKGDRGLFKSIIRGCYWLVDDMYKFEHMGYTKEINQQNTAQANLSEALSGLRYLACADCNLCPLGWFNPNTKESYLHVWINKSKS